MKPKLGTQNFVSKIAENNIKLVHNIVTEQLEEAKTNLLFYTCPYFLLSMQIDVTMVGHHL